MDFETFRTVDAYEKSNLTQKTPSCINGRVRIEKYRITVNVIPETLEVYEQRLQDLWDNSTNHHDSDTLSAKAKELGYQLIGARGNKVKK